MKLEERDLKETEKTRISWAVVYLFAAITLFRRSEHVWDIVYSQSFRTRDVVFAVLGLVFCLFPLLFGLVFRGALKEKLSEDLFNAKTYQFCNYWIATLLYISYVAILGFD